ncbi:hypothetical protein [Blastococcus sp. SYSU DS0619]
MTSYRVVVTYTIEVEDRDALLRAGAAAWAASAGGWAIRAEDDGGSTEAPAGEAEAEEVAPGPEASVAFVLGAQPYPSVPGVWFGASSVDVQPVTAG